jgi:hypothetical protein
VFHLPLRQTEGFLSSLICLMRLDLKTPDHTTLSRRSAMVEVPEFVRRGGQPIHLTIDSTGLKIMGNGEWHSLKLKPSNQRRAWRKLHLAVDGEGFLIAFELTGSGVDDASVGVAMIERIEAEIARFTADGAYDTRAIYAALHEAGPPIPTIVLPPRKTASASMPPDDILQQRDVAVARIAEVGRRQWRKEAGAHQQARAENGMYRYKRIIGNSLRGRTMATQKVEAKTGVLVINRMTALGRPSSVAISR